jgi:hypothetical protein
VPGREQRLAIEVPHVLFHPAQEVGVVPDHNGLAQDAGGGIQVLVEEG